MYGGNNTFIVSTEASRIGMIGGLIVDTDYNKYKHAVQVGRIEALPLRVTSQYKYDTELSIGDTILFHHFICQPDHKVNVGELTYRCEYFHMFARMNGKTIEALEDIIFVEPIKDSAENNTSFCGLILKNTFDVVKQQGIVYAPSKQAMRLGIFPGDKIFFTQSADYSINVGGKNLYRMRIRNIVAIERDGELVCLKDKIIVKDTAPVVKEKLLQTTDTSNKLFGEIVAVGANLNEVSIGDKICYFRGVNGSIQHKGEWYSFIDIRHINYLIKDDMETPMLNRVMIRQDEGQDKIGVLEVPDNAKTKPRRGTVIAVGPGERNTTDGSLIPMQVKAGDKVIYGEFASIEVEVNGQKVVMAKESDLILIL